VLPSGEGDFSGIVDWGTDDRSMGDDTVLGAGAVAQPANNTTTAAKTSPLKFFVPLARSNMPVSEQGKCQPGAASKLVSDGN